MDTIKIKPDHRIQGNELWMEHHKHRRPGQIGLFTDEGKLENDSATYVNGKAWIPRWSGNVSLPFSGVQPLIPQSGFRLTKRAGRGTVSVKEMPSKENYYTLSILIDDNANPGTSFYDITIEW